MHILSVCIGSVLGMQVICIELISLYVQVFIPSVNELCSIVPNSHVKSRVCFRVLSRNSQRGDCKVEFNQPSCWLYSVPNLIVF